MPDAIEIHDRIYGMQAIHEPVLLTLMQAPSVERLKSIYQFGVPPEFYPVPNYTRHEHSYGVMAALRLLSAPLEEQVAGLLHDVSHAAFSHVYDWVIGDYSKPGQAEDLQDRRHISFVQNSELVTILSDHGFQASRVCDHQNFGLLEREIPQLCVDRVDYLLRELPLDLARTIWTGVGVVMGHVVCRSFEAAQLLGRTYMDRSLNHWTSTQASTRFYIFSEALKRALNLGVINIEDFEADDTVVTEKVLRSKDRAINRWLDFLRQPVLPEVEEGKKVYHKFRYIDPPYAGKSGLELLSEHDLEYAALLKLAHEKNELGVVVPDIDSL